MSTTSTTTSTTTAAYAAEDISWVALFVVILVLSLAAVIVGMRIYTRIFLVKQLGNDDYCIVVTLVCPLPPCPDEQSSCCLEPCSPMMTRQRYTNLLLVCSCSSWP